MIAARARAAPSTRTAASPARCGSRRRRPADDRASGCARRPFRDRGCRRDPWAGRTRSTGGGLRPRRPRPPPAAARGPRRPSPPSPCSTTGYRMPNFFLVPPAGSNQMVIPSRAICMRAAGVRRRQPDVEELAVVEELDRDRVGAERLADGRTSRRTAVDGDGAVEPLALEVRPLGRGHDRRATEPAQTHGRTATIEHGLTRIFISWSAIQELVERWPADRAQDGADGGVEIALLLVEALARLAVHGVEAIAPLVEDLLHLVPLRGVELQLGREAIDEFRRQRRRAAGPAAEERRPGPPRRGPARRGPPKHRAAVRRARWRPSPAKNGPRGTGGRGGIRRRRRDRTRRARRARTRSARGYRTRAPPAAPAARRRAARRR